MNKLKRMSERISDDALAGRIAGRIIFRQRQLADYLNAKTKNLNGKGMLMLLIIFSTLLGSYCAYLIIHACK